MPFLTSSDYHWAQYLLYVGPWSALFFHSGHCLVPTSCRMGPISGSFSCSILRATGSQLAAATTALACTCFTSARASTLWQWVHSSWHGHLERASALLCFQPCQCLEVKLYSCKRWIQRTVCSSRFLKLVSHVNAEWSVHRWNSCPYRYLMEVFQCPHYGK
jgi:hypothetical protein